MRAFSGDVQARWQARKDQTDADAVHRPRARTDVPNQQFLASTVRAVDGHNRRLAQRSKGGDGAAGAPRADADDRRAGMLDERLDWAARKAAAAAAADDSDDDDGSADDKRARKKAKKKALKREAKSWPRKLLPRRRRKRKGSGGGERRPMRSATRCARRWASGASRRRPGAAVSDNRTGAARAQRAGASERRRGGGFVVVVLMFLWCVWSFRGNPHAHAGAAGTRAAVAHGCLAHCAAHRFCLK